MPSSSLAVVEKKRGKGKAPKGFPATSSDNARRKRIKLTLSSSEIKELSIFFSSHNIDSLLTYHIPLDKIKKAKKLRRKYKKGNLKQLLTKMMAQIILNEKEDNEQNEKPGRITHYEIFFSAHFDLLWVPALSIISNVRKKEMIEEAMDLCKQLLHFNNNSPVITSSTYGSRGKTTNSTLREIVRSWYKHFEKLKKNMGKFTQPSSSHPQKTCNPSPTLQD